MSEDEGREEEGNGDEFMSRPSSGRQSGEQFQGGALPERAVAKPNRVIHIRPTQRPERFAMAPGHVSRDYDPEHYTKIAMGGCFLVKVNL